jgi:hypothetical protein
MTCQFTFSGLRKKALTVKGSGCVALGHPVTSAKNWLLEEDDRSKADGGFGTAPALLLQASTGQTTNGCGRRRRCEGGDEQATPIPSDFEDSRNLERHAEA